MGTPECCKRGFHFCQKLEDCFNYYSCITWNKIAEVEALGEVDKQDDDSKCATNKIKILKEIPFSEIGQHIKDGINESYGINGSFGILNSYGVDNSLFLANKLRTYSIFGKDVSVERFKEVKKTLYLKLKGWEPTFNNLKSLYLKSGSEWRLTPIPEAAEISKEEAWQSMPKEAIDYIASLPEFDAEMFKEITGIEVKAND